MLFFCFKHKTAYEMRISDWSSDVCSSDLITWPGEYLEQAIDLAEPTESTIILIHSHPGGLFAFSDADDESDLQVISSLFHAFGALHGSAIMTTDGAVHARLYDPDLRAHPVDLVTVTGDDLSYWWRSEEHTSELQSLMRISYAVFCLKKKKQNQKQ